MKNQIVYRERSLPKRINNKIL